MDGWHPKVAAALALESLVAGRRGFTVRERTLPEPGNGGRAEWSDLFDLPMDDVRRVASCVKHGRRR